MRDRRTPQNTFFTFARRPVASAMLIIGLSLSCWAAAPVPLVAQGRAVNWWFVFKFNSGTAPGCAGTAVRTCPFGGAVAEGDKFSQQFAFATNRRPVLRAGGGCLGTSGEDPVGATFEQIYRGKFFYVVWNDQFGGNPIPDRASPAGHSKGLLAWDTSGNGLVMQVTTPSWPGSASAEAPRQGEGNTLGCMERNNVLVSQHFFALRLKKPAVVTMLKALINANVATSAARSELVRNGGPAEIQTLVGQLGTAAKSKTPTVDKLPGGITVISKPSGLHVPPWQMVSALLGGVHVRAATWWTRPEIPSTTKATPIGCWSSSLGQPGPVEIATTGTWDGQPIGLRGSPSPQGNHAKIGVAQGTKPLAIFGDLNQQGALSGGPSECDNSQNGRGGLFFVLSNRKLATSVGALITGETAP